MLYIQNTVPQSLYAKDIQKQISSGNLPTRDEQLISLQTQEFDVLVIGGGATGCGVALDAVSRGQSHE